MPTLRGGDTDTAKIADWLGRKIANHNPLSELALPAGGREALPRFYDAEGIGETFKLKSDPDAVFARSPDGRVFRVLTEEVDPGEIDALVEQEQATERDSE